MTRSAAAWSLLIADDDDPWRLTLRDVFEWAGFETILASNGREVVEIVRERRIHCLVLDVHMPELTGLEALQIVRERQIVLPCVMVTAEPDRDIIRQASILQVFSVLRKPVSREEITSVVRQALAQSFPDAAAPCA